MARTATMTCDACGRTAPWNPWGACSISCFDRPRPTSEEQRDMVDAAPEALAWFPGISPGVCADDGG
ncbi:hypothetical protein [Kitasatospora sp. NPDC056531]|uniref:hypothetical protein n=1 Tax=Kitasatospora sp. NPDC056531 TaxID=3345856 RepID=UPI0036C5B44D